MSLIHTLFFALYFFLLLVLSVAALYFLKVFLHPFVRKELYGRLVMQIVSRWGRMVLWGARTKIEIHGLEKLPDTDKLCFVSNHQSYTDIPLILGFIPKNIGFVAKIELLKIPLLSFGMKTINCVFLDRKNARLALASINRGAENIRAGIPMVIFPEGTRSKKKEMNKFLAGSLKMALLSEATIVPLTIDGTYKVLEQKGRITPATVKLYIHPPIDISKLAPEEKKKLPQLLREIIASPLQDKGHPHPKD